MVGIEAGLIFAGYEFCDQTAPFEAGIGFTVPLKSKEDDFIGRQALEQRKVNPQRKLVGLELEGNEPAAHGDCVKVCMSFLQNEIYIQYLIETCLPNNRLQQHI